MNPPVHRAVVLTPPGTGAIALIRVAGPDPASLLRDMMPNSNIRGDRLIPGRLSFSRLIDGDEVLDDVVMSVEPTEGTGFAIDIFCHGGIRIVQRILERLKHAGVTVDAKPGPGFWQPASRIEAEAVSAMIQARTRRAVAYAARIRNELPGRIKNLAQEWTLNRERCERLLDELIDHAEAARSLLGGVQLALVGPTNSGKSTLFNTLLGRPAAVTSPIPGTTRDWICERVEFGGLSVELLDTAGRRTIRDSLEAQAIHAGSTLAQKSHATVIVLDGSIPAPALNLEDFAVQSPKTWLVANKSDLGYQWSGPWIENVAKRFGAVPTKLSARTGEGCELLKRAVLEHFGLADPLAPDEALFTARQIELADRIRLDPDRGGRLLQLLLGDPAGVETP